jgi:hypothetical protein
MLNSTLPRERKRATSPVRPLTETFVQCSDGHAVNIRELVHAAPLPGGLYRLDLRRLISGQPYLFSTKCELVRAGVLRQ